MNAPAKRSPTGFVAQRMPEEGADGARWVLVYFESGSGLAMRLFTDAEVANWPDLIEAIEVIP